MNTQFLNTLYRLSRLVPTALFLSLIVAGVGRLLPLGTPAPWWAAAGMLAVGGGLLVAAHPLYYEVRVYGSDLGTDPTRVRPWVTARIGVITMVLIVSTLALLLTGNTPFDRTGILWLVAVAAPLSLLLGILSGVPVLQRLAIILTPWSAVAWYGGVPWADAGSWTGKSIIGFGLASTAVLVVVELAGTTLQSYLSHASRYFATGLMAARFCVAALAAWALVGGSG